MSMSTKHGAADFHWIEGSPIAMASLFGPEHVLRDVNGAFCRLVGEDRAALVGHPLLAVVPSRDDEGASGALLDRVYRTGEAGTLADDPRAQPSTAFWTWWAWAIAAADGAGTAGVMVQVADTTEPRRLREIATQMNQELLLTSVRLHEQMETMQRLRQEDRTKDEFLAMLAHELRNPLNAIGAAAALIEARSEGQAALQKEVAIVMRQVRHTARLVEDLLDVSRITRGKLAVHPEPINLTEILRSAADAVLTQMEPTGRSLSCSMPPDPVWMSGDPARLEQVVGNLLNNAAKYSDPGGNISVTLRRETDWAVIEVADAGAGIAPAMLPRVFDLFSQEERSLDRARGGLGIGLALVKALVELHGGTVEAQSAGPGRGSAFIVRLPVTPAREASPPASDPTPTPTLNILLAEDNADAAAALGDVLEMWGQTVRITHDGAETIEAARQCPPDLVLLDIGLPKMDGYEVARALRSCPETASVFLVALTGYGREDDRRRAQEAGFDRHLVKPVDFVELKAILVAAARR
jgi:signal transduction histidine kinase